MTELTDDDRDALLEALAEHTRTDPKPFVSARLALPDQAHFPDEFERDADSLSMIAARLLSYAGHEDLALDVALDPQATASKKMLPETRADLAGLEDGVVYVSCTQLGRADDAVLALTHEVARAALLVRDLARGGGPYRRPEATGMVRPEDSDDEHFRASVCATYLGLGALVVRGSHHYRQAERVRAVNRPDTEWQHVSYGGLRPAEASFLLAAQLVTRGIDDARLERLLALLDRERADEIRAEMAELDRDALIRRLGLPPIATWLPAPEGEP